MCTQVQVYLFVLGYPNFYLNFYLSLPLSLSLSLSMRLCSACFPKFCLSLLLSLTLSLSMRLPPRYHLSLLLSSPPTLNLYPPKLLYPRCNPSFRPPPHPFIGFLTLFYRQDHCMCCRAVGGGGRRGPSPCHLASHLRVTRLLTLFTSTQI